MWLREYGPTLKTDIGAALTVAFDLIPQSIAYALLAELPPEYGLYAALVPLPVHALLQAPKLAVLSSSESLHLHCGPSTVAHREQFFHALMDASELLVRGSAGSPCTCTCRLRAAFPLGPAHAR